MQLVTALFAFCFSLLQGAHVSLEVTISHNKGVKSVLQGVELFF
jgi:hypothetical protein